MEGCRVLDLFAGSGALGIEALSRGAVSACFVERAAPSLHCLRANLAALALESRSRVVAGDALRGVRRLSRDGARFELILADPPYGSDAGPRVLAGVSESGLLASGGLLVIESDRRHPPGNAQGLRTLDQRRYGDTLVSVYTPNPQPGSGDESRPRGGDERHDSMTAPKVGLALFPASFDPVTNGHLDLVHRARRIFPELVVAVAHNVEKTGTFPVEERLEMLRGVLGDLPGVQVTAFEGLLVDYAHEIGAKTVIRGLRANSDFEYEFEMALMNRHMRPEIETLFLMTSQQYFYVSSSRLKELVRFGADIGEWVPPIVAKHLREKLGRRD